jgi:hypothetical protein
MHINEFGQLNEQDKQKATEALRSELLELREAKTNKSFVELSPQNSELLGSAVHNLLHMLKNKNNNKPK